MKSFIKSILVVCCVTICVLFFQACRKEVSPVTKASDAIAASKITPELGASGTTLTLQGSGLGDIKTIVFEKDAVSASFNPILNTDDAIIFRVPTAATPGQQNIILTNGDGKSIKVPFNVLGLATITDVSNYDFETGSQITLTGKNLADVSAVKFSGSTEVPTIVSKTPTTLVISMPTTAKFRTNLDITNLAGTTITQQEFVSLTNNFKFFADAYENGEQDASWGDAAFISTTNFKTGTASFGKNFQKDNWHQCGFGWNAIPNNNYKYLTFWVKGGSVDIDFWVWTQQTQGGNDVYNNTPNKITVPANVWTYFKLSVSQLDLWKNGTTFNQIGWRLKGPFTQDEKIYFDDVMLVK